MPSELTVEQVLDTFGCADAEYLGRGGFGETWRLRGLELDGTVDDYAVKILHAKTASPQLVKREIDGLSRFDHPNIVKLHDVRETEIVGESRTILVCEYLPGGNVRQKVDADGLPTVAEALAFARALLGTVSVLHDREQIHRDIKPDNIILRDGEWASPVLIDFGLSRGLNDQTFTQYPALMGTATFMAPEQLRGQKARKAADLWACGIVLYMILSGRHPYIETLDGLLLDDLVDLVVGPPSSLGADVPTALDDLVGRLLSDREHLRGSARRAAKELEGLEP